MSELHRCRSCAAPLRSSFCDLGESPLSNSYLPAQWDGAPEAVFPLHAWVCDECLLVQLPAWEDPAAIFSDYAYFSSYSSSWVEHAKRYVELAIPRFALDADSLVVEIASNDGYLLRHFLGFSIPVLGIEPAANVAAVALQHGVPSLVRFFGEQVARELRDSQRCADLIVGNNVLAHVPDLNDFIAGVALLLKPGGAATFEFPHLMQLMQQRQFDTIYHEHYSYLSLVALQPLIDRHGLSICRVEELSTHGGSLRIELRRAGALVDDSVAEVLDAERRAGLDQLAGYASFDVKVQDLRRQIIEFVRAERQQGHRIWGYGAPAKGNTLLNYCGLGVDDIEATVDLNPNKQGTWLPGSHIPVRTPDALVESRPELIIILPWNLRAEIADQLRDALGPDVRMATLIPEPVIL